MARSSLAVLAAVCGFAWSPTALAAGGASIASAPIVRPGVEQTANTTTDATVQGADGPQAVGCWIDFEYWRLPLSAGDRVQIRGSAIPPMTNLELGVFPPGTTDANIASAKQTITGFPTAAQSLQFTAPASGTYVVVGGPNCYNSDGGPFTFAVAVSPPATAAAVAVALPSLTRIPVTGSLAATVRSGRDHPVSDAALSLKLYGSWTSSSGATGTHLLASATPVRGVARFAYHLPATVHGTSIVLQVASSSAPGFRAAASTHLTVTVS